MKLVLFSLDPFTKLLDMQESSLNTRSNITY